MNRYQEGPQIPTPSGRVTLAISQVPKVEINCSGPSDSTIGPNCWIHFPTTDHGRMTARLDGPEGQPRETFRPFQTCYFIEAERFEAHTEQVCHPQLHGVSQVLIH